MLLRRFWIQNVQSRRKTADPAARRNRQHTPTSFRASIPGCVPQRRQGGNKKMQVDTFASALKAGERPACSGLVLIVGWCWGDQDEGYQKLASEMRSLDDSHHTSLVYDGEYTHCTCATLSRYAADRTPSNSRYYRSRRFCELHQINKKCINVLCSQIYCHSAEQIMSSCTFFFILPLLHFRRSTDCFLLN